MTVQEKGQQIANPLNEFLIEQEVLDLLGMSKGQLDRLRKKGLPYCGISNTMRMYLVVDIVDFIKTKRRIVSDNNPESTEAQKSVSGDDESSWKGVGFGRIKPEED